MRELPILMNGAMVRAVLEGRKTVTRRPVNPQPSKGFDYVHPTEFEPGVVCWTGSTPTPRMLVGTWTERKTPYRAGDRLYVRETTVNVEDHGYLGPVFAASDEGAAIREGGLGPAEDDCEVEPEDIKLRTALHMPKAWARIWLEVTGVRVERLHVLNRGDAMAEGCPFPNMASGPDPRRWFSDLWESINGAGSWADNPWVWVVEFKRTDMEVPHGE